MLFGVVLGTATPPTTHRDNTRGCDAGILFMSHLTHFVSRCFEMIKKSTVQNR